MLTRRQKAAFDFICAETVRNGGVSPSYAEIAGALGLKARSGACGVIEDLIQRGFIRRIPGKHRAIEVIRGLVVPMPPLKSARRHPVTDRRCISIPVMGKIN